MRTGVPITGRGESIIPLVLIIILLLLFLILYFTREHYQDIIVPGVFNRKYSIPSATEDRLPDEVAFMSRYKK